MKRYALLFLLLLGISSTASGYCTISINLDEITCGQPITNGAVIKCSGTCEKTDVLETRVGDNTLYADVLLDCQSPSGTSTICLQGTAFSEAKCGRYFIVIRVWCDYTGSGCFPYCCYPQPVYCGVAVKTFTVFCDDCGGCPCRCAPLYPCCPE